MKATLQSFLLWAALGFFGAALAADQLTRELGVRGSLMGNEYRANALMAYAQLDVAPDVVVVGSSRVAGGVHSSLIEDALRLGPGIEASVYELGLSGLRVEWLRHMLATVFEDQPPRKVLVLAVEARFFAFGQSVTGAGGEVQDIAGEWDTDVPHPFTEEWFGGLRDLYAVERLRHAGVRGVIATRQANGGETADFEGKVIEERARQAKRRQLVKNLGLNEIPDAFADGSLKWKWPEADSPTMKAWREVLDRCEALDCDVVFVRMPLAPGFDEQSMPEIFPLFERDVIDAVRARGMDFVDLQGPGWNDNPNWFYSTTHLGIQGVRPVSRRLAQQVIAPHLR